MSLVTLDIDCRAKGAISQPELSSERLEEIRGKADAMEPSNLKHDMFQLIAEIERLKTELFQSEVERHG